MASFIYREHSYCKSFSENNVGIKEEVKEEVEECLAVQPEISAALIFLEHNYSKFVKLDIPDTDDVPNNEIMEVKEEVMEDEMDVDPQNDLEDQMMEEREDIGDNAQVDEEEEIKLISFGPNGTIMPLLEFTSIDWKNYRRATRKLLMLVFDKETLASHSLTGRRSNAFLDTNKTARPQLNVARIQDIESIVTEMCEVENFLVRQVVTHKCADEHKLWKNRNN